MTKTFRPTILFWMGLLLAFWCVVLGSEGLIDGAITQGLGLQLIGILLVVLMPRMVISKECFLISRRKIEVSEIKKLSYVRRTEVLTRFNLSTGIWTPVTWAQRCLVIELKTGKVLILPMFLWTSSDIQKVLKFIETNFPELDIA